MGMNRIEAEHVYYYPETQCIVVLLRKALEVKKRNLTLISKVEHKQGDFINALIQLMLFFWSSCKRNFQTHRTQPITAAS